MKVRIYLSYYYTKHKALGATLRLFQTIIYGFQGTDKGADFVVTLEPGKRTFTRGKIFFEDLPVYMKSRIMKESKKRIASIRKRLREGKPGKDHEEFVL
jgi:hypothetical protein